VKPNTRLAAKPWPIMKHDIISEVKMKKIKKETATFTCLVCRLVCSQEMGLRASNLGEGLKCFRYGSKVVNSD